MANTIKLLPEQLKGLLLLCGHDASHDFFQSKPKPWVGVGGSSLINKKLQPIDGGGNRHKQRARLTKQKMVKNSQVKNSQVKNLLGKKSHVKVTQNMVSSDPILNRDRSILSDELDNINDICYQCGESSFLDNELNELGNDLNIYEYFSKNITEMNKLVLEEVEVGVEGPMDIKPTESWIYVALSFPHKRDRELESESMEVDTVSPLTRTDSMKVDPVSPLTRTDSMKVDPVSSIEVSSRPYKRNRGNTLSGGSPRIRTNSALKQKQLDEIKKKKDEIWKEIEQWNEAVTIFIDMDDANKFMNLEMNNNKLETYHDMCGKSKPLAKVDFYLNDLEKYAEYRQFRKKYKSLNIERYIKSNWNINMSNDTHKTFYEFNLKKKGPTLSNNQIKFLNDLHINMMDLWCRLIYGHTPKDTPPPSSEKWIINQYNSMRKTVKYPKSPTDKNLLDQFVTSNKVIRNETKTIPISGDLLYITNNADKKKSIINNAAPLQKYCEKSVSNQLFVHKGQYHCVGPSVMDPSSICPKLSKPPIYGNETFIIKDVLGTSIEMSYNIVSPQKKVSIKIKLPYSFANPQIELNETVDLNTLPISKNLRISEVIQRIIQNLASKDKPILISDDNLLIELIQICLGKLCGDFSQEILAIINIQKKIPTVFVANDGPSSVRFLYMISCLIKQGVEHGPFWGGYMTAQRLLLLTSIDDNSIKGSIKRKKRSIKRKKRSIKSKKGRIKSKKGRIKSKKGSIKSKKRSINRKKRSINRKKGKYL